MSERLDCETPRGVVMLRAQHEIVRRFADAHPGLVVFETKHPAAHVDAVFTRGPHLTLIAEAKVRPDLGLATLRERFGSYLISAEKLRHGELLAQTLRVPYAVIAGLTDAIVWWMVYDADGQRLVDFTLEETTTQATVNGGRVQRLNAFLSLDRMHVIPGGVVVEEVE